MFGGLAHANDFMLRYIQEGMVLPEEEWPQPIADVIKSGARLKNNSCKTTGTPSRHKVWLFFLHNGANPKLTLEWLHQTGRLKSDALQDMARVLKVLQCGASHKNYKPHKIKTFDLRTNRIVFTPCALPCLHGIGAARERDAEVEKAIRYAKLHGAACTEGNSVRNGGDHCEEAGPARRVYFETLLPWEPLVHLLHRKKSPIQLREITVGKNSPWGRSQPVLSICQLQAQAQCRPLSLHAGVAFEETSQERRSDIQGAALGTELCLEIDEVPEALGGEKMSEHLRWIWLKHALTAVLHVLVKVYGYRHFLTFVSGNRGPHCWLLDENVFQQTAADRVAFFASLELKSATEFPLWWRAHARPICHAFYVNVVLAKKEQGGFGWSSPNPRVLISDADLATLTWPTFDAAVACDVNHLHRLPFSVHEKTMRIAIPFDGVDTMPTSLNEAPRVDDTDLAEKLRAPCLALQNVVTRLAKDGLLHDRNTRDAFETFMANPVASWAVKKTADHTVNPLKRKRPFSSVDIAAPPTAEHLLAPLPIHLDGVAAWRLVLSSACHRNHFDTDGQHIERAYREDMHALAKKARKSTQSAWRERFRYEIQRLDVLLGYNSRSLTNIVANPHSGDRMSVFHPEIVQKDFLKTVASCTRHRITDHRLLELDISAAHPSVAWAAVRAYFKDRAETICPKLALLCTDRDKAVDQLNAEYKQAMTSTGLKKKLLSALNQTADDSSHEFRKPFLKALVEERIHMEEALCAFSPLQHVMGAIKQRADAKDGPATFLSMLMRAAENLVIVTAINGFFQSTTNQTPEHVDSSPFRSFEATGFRPVGVISDALLLEPLHPPHPIPNSHAARDHLMAAGAHLDIPLTVKIDHDCSYQSTIVD